MERKITGLLLGDTFTFTCSGHGACLAFMSSMKWADIKDYSFCIRAKCPHFKRCVEEHYIEPWDHERVEFGGGSSVE